MSILESAQQYIDAGLSVIPVKADGSKSPVITGWRAYSNKLADAATLAEWFAPGKVVGIGVVPGPASGNLVILDFEHRDGESAYVEWIRRLPDDLRELAETLPTVTTPSGGRHIWIRLPAAQPGARLARYANAKTKIEIRGEGHQVLAPGCPPECHATGNLYEWAIRGEVAELEIETWQALVYWCCQCNDFTAPEQTRDRDHVAPGTPAGADSPGNDFNRRGTWGETGLFDAGWTWAKRVEDDRGFLTRPGKDTGISASIGMVSSRENGYPYLYVWSTSTEFAPETPFSRFAVFASLKHKGNYSEAAKDLARLGYGERLGMGGDGTHQADLSGFTMKVNTPDGKPSSPFAKPKEAPTTDDRDDRPFRWMSELTRTDDDAKWLWKGYIPRGGITLFSALWKSGKSTILSHLLKSLDGSVSHFLGLEVVPSRVLYVSEEDEKIWADRRDKMLIGDHVGMWCRPFKLRPTMQEWRDHIGTIGEQVQRHQFDLVIYDTLSKMWPVREENDAGQVEEALMPLWNISNKGTSIFLVHHTRKSGGEQFVGARGSGGLPAFCELLMEFRRASDNPKETQRIITATGRYSDIPVKLLCELTQGRYVSHGDPDDKEAENEKEADGLRDAITVAMGSAADWRTVDELSATLPKGTRKGNIVLTLNKLIEGGEAERSGDGKKNDPYRFRLVS